MEKLIYLTSNIYLNIFFIISFLSQYNFGQKVLHFYINK